MADKYSTGSLYTPIDPSAVTTSGTIATGIVRIDWDDADTTLDILDMLEKARVQMLNYRFKNF